MKKFINFIETHFSLTKKTLIPKNWEFLCTVSSGQDSTFAFFLLIHLNLKTSLQILYCHHFWQLKNFLTIRELYQLSYFTNVSYNVIFPKKMILKENQAREWRKNNFGRFSQLQHIPYLITGHTETDIIEKNLNNICRGTSLRSFSTVNPVNAEKKLNLFFFKVSTSLTLNEVTFHCLKRFPRKSNEKRILFFIPNNSRKRKAKEFSSNNNFHFSKRKKVTTTFFLPRIQFAENFTTKPLFNISFCSDSKNFSYSFWFGSEFDFLVKTSINPLQRTKRLTISKILNLYSLPLVVDLTNFSSNFSRNKIRHQLIPLSQFLLFRNTESLLITFFQTLQFSTADQEQKLQDFSLVSDFLLITTTKKNQLVIKRLIPQVSENKTQYLFQKLFFDSKQVTLNFSQLITLTKLIVTSSL